MFLGKPTVPASHRARLASGRSTSSIQSDCGPSGGLRSSSSSNLFRTPGPVASTLRKPCKVSERIYKSSDQDENLPQNELDDVKILFAIRRYKKLQAKKQELIVRQNVLREKFSQTLQLEAKVSEMETDLEAKRLEMNRMVVLKRALRVGNLMKDFCQQDIEPLLKSNIPLNMSDQEFEQLKATINAFNANFATPEDREQVLTILNKIESLNLEDNFVSDTCDGNWMERIKSVNKQMDTRMDEIEKLNGDIHKYESLLKKLNEENNVEAKKETEE